MANDTSITVRAHPPRGHVRASSLGMRARGHLRAARGARASRGWYERLIGLTPRGSDDTREWARESGSADFARPRALSHVISRGNAGGIGARAPRNMIDRYGRVKPRLFYGTLFFARGAGD